MQFHQVLVSANPGDAITTAAFELRDLLRQFGPSEIYARYVHPKLFYEVKELRYFAGRKSVKMADDVMIYHASIGEPDVTRFVASRPERLAVVYHNISPPERFLAFDPKFAGLLAAGRIELASLADKAITAITVSEYNAAELRDMGFTHVHVSPLVVDLEKLRAIEPSGPTMNHFENGIEGPMILFVGQLLPHKRPDLLLQAYHVLSTHIMPEAALVIAGNHRLPQYSEYLEHQLNELNLNKAWMTGSVDISTLMAFYRSADMFVTMSEHEGFCVPLIEAMGFDVPVLARATTAIPETAGDAAILLPEEEDNPLVIAEAMNELLTDHLLRKQLIKRGRERVEHYDPDIARATMLNHVLAVAE